MGYRLNRLDEPIFMAVSKPMQTEFGIHHRLESCALFSAKPWHRQFCSEASLYYLWRLWSQSRTAKPSSSVSTFTDQTAVVVSLTSRSGHSLIFFSLLFSIYMKSMPPHGRGYCSPFLPATPSSRSRTLDGLFELTRRPSRALDSPPALLPELQRNKVTVRFGGH